MNTIEITYRQFPFLTRRIKSELPASWNELTEKQFIAAAAMIENNDPSLQWLSVMTALPYRLMTRLSHFFVYNLTVPLAFLSDIKPLSTFKIDKLPKCKFVAPAPKLEGFSFGQFIFADAYCNDYQLEKSTLLLDKLVATLYMPSGQSFTDNTVKSAIDTIAREPKPVKQAIALNFIMVCLWLKQCYPLIFADDSPDQNGELKQSGNNQSGWIKIFNNMVGDDIIRRDEYARLPLHTALRFLTDKYKENMRSNSHSRTIKK